MKLATNRKPVFGNDVFGKTIDIPDPDIHTVGGKPVYQWETHPHLWAYSPKTKPEDYWTKSPGAHPKGKSRPEA